MRIPHKKEALKEWNDIPPRIVKGRVVFWKYQRGVLKKCCKDCRGTNKKWWCLNCVYLQEKKAEAAEVSEK